MIRRTTDFGRGRLRRCPSVGPASSSATGCSCCWSGWPRSSPAAGRCRGCLLSSRTRSPSPAPTPNARRRSSRAASANVPTAPSSSSSTSPGPPTAPSARPRAAASGSLPGRSRRATRARSDPAAASSGPTSRRHSTCSTPKRLHGRRPPLAPGNRRLARLRHRAAGDPARPRPRASQAICARSRRSRSPSRCVVLVAVFGVSLAVAIPFVFAACTIGGTLVIVWRRRPLALDGRVRDEPRRADRARARDRLLAAHRLPLPRGARPGGSRRRDAIVPHDGDRRPVRSSSPAWPWPIGLAVLLFVPVPFIRSMGVGGLLDPARLDRGGADAAAGAALVARARGSRLERCPRARLDDGPWARLARAIMRRPLALPRPPARPSCSRAAAPALLLAADARARFSRSRRATRVRRRGLDALATASARARSRRREIVVDAGAPGGARDAATSARGRRGWRPARSTTRRRYIVASGPRAAVRRPARGRYARVIVVGRHEYGDDGRAAASSRRLRRRSSRARASRRARASTSAARRAQGVDFLAPRVRRPSRGSCSAALVLTYLVLLRAFRSLLLPLKAVAAEPALGRRGLRAARRRLPLGRRRRPARRSTGRPDRGLDPDLPLRDALRPLDGLRGVPRLAHARGVGRGERQRARRRGRARAHRPASSRPPR